MSNSKAKLKNIRQLNSSLEKSYLLHMAAFADSVDRYIDIQLKDNVNWLKLFALIILIINNGSLTPSELGRKILRPKDSVTKLVGVLVKEGLVKRYRQGKDRRSIQIILCEAGLTFVASVLENLESVDQSIEDAIGKDELKKLFSVISPLGDWFTKGARENYY